MIEIKNRDVVRCLRALEEISRVSYTDVKVTIRISDMLEAVEESFRRVSKIEQQLRKDHALYGEDGPVLLKDANGETQAGQYRLDPAQFEEWQGKQEELAETVFEVNVRQLMMKDLETGKLRDKDGKVYAYKPEPFVIVGLGALLQRDEKEGED